VAACQGDIVQLTSAAPCINATGNAIVTDITFDHWMIVGNTCDMHRDDEPRSLIAPLVGLAEPVPDEQLHTLRRYEYSRQFYVPPWPGAEPAATPSRRLHAVGHHRESGVREDCACVVARLQFPAWALLHSCLVRSSLVMMAASIDHNASARSVALIPSHDEERRTGSV
jgi:hypothetical protein